MVWYVCAQSTETPRRRHSSSNSFSSSAVRRSHSSTKLRRLTGTWSAALTFLSVPSNGGSKSGS